MTKNAILLGKKRGFNETTIDKKTDDTKHVTACNGCGRKHPNHEQCILRDHPDFNKSNKSWVESEKGKLWAAKDAKVEVLPWFQTLAGTKWEAPDKPVKKFRPQGKLDNNPYYLTYTNCNNCNNTERIYLNSLHNTDNFTDTFPVICLQEKDLVHVNLNALLDSGALQENYVSKSVIEKLGLETKNIINKVVCSGFTEDCKSLITSEVDITITVYNETNDRMSDYFTIRATVIDTR